MTPLELNIDLIHWQLHWVIGIGIFISLTLFAILLRLLEMKP